MGLFRHTYALKERLLGIEGQCRLIRNSIDNPKIPQEKIIAEFDELTSIYEELKRFVNTNK